MKKEIITTETEAENQKKPAKKPIRILTAVLNVVIDVLIVLVLIVSLLIATLALTSKANKDGLPNVFGYTLQYVQSPSMSKPSPDGYDGGNFTEEDVIIGRIYKAEEFPELRAGDIVTYNSHEKAADGSERLVAHRIIKVAKTDSGETVYLTQGDNRDVAQVPDQNEEDVNTYLHASDVISVIYSSKYHGTVLQGFAGFFRFIRSQQGFFLMILLPMIAFFMYAIVRVVLSVINYRKDKSASEKEVAEKEKQEAVEAAVKAALAEKNGSADSSGDMSAEQMEQFKQFLAFQKAQQAAADDASTETADDAFTEVADETPAAEPVDEHSPDGDDLARDFEENQN